ncbi:hypothetical protein T484DRAFT_3366985 [Baffinella frigidus]|nr:hypothetical protein T484DRAFT_3366985 [Cryptophyta sp. CCMP2293]
MSLQMACPLTPLGANVIIKLERASNTEKKTESGILMAASVEDKGPVTGIIEAVGSGFFTEQGVKIPIDEVKVGDKVMFRQPTSFENRRMKVDAEEYYVLSVRPLSIPCTVTSRLPPTPVISCCSLLPYLVDSVHRGVWCC